MPQASKTEPQTDATGLGWLGIETGGTHTSVLQTDAEGRVEQRFDLGPANLRLISDDDLFKMFRSIRKATGHTGGIAAGLAGLRTETDRERVLAIASRVWPRIPFLATNDLETPLAAAGELPPGAEARVLLLSGTGSCAYGRSRDGRTVKFGGRGHILGDQGSACDIALVALRRIVYQHDLKEKFPPLGHAVLRALLLNHPDDLIPWTQGAAKQDIAALAMTVFAEAKKGDELAREVLRNAAETLADMALRCAGHLVAARSRVQFLFSGSVLLKQRSFAAAVSRRLHEQWPKCRVVRLRRESVWGAVELARRQGGGAGFALGSKPETKARNEVVSLESLAHSPTELRNPRSMHLDTMPVAEAIELMVDENALAAKAVLQASADIEWTIAAVVRAFKSGGRLFYVGAGTSGRLGVLDATECPPTFRVSPEQVQGIMAGGQRALWSAVEGAEDAFDGGAAAVRDRGLKKADIIIGIAASGRTPYVWGALQEARQLGCQTVLLAFNPGMKVKAGHEPDRMILINTGPEVLTGSTRLKAGTATKVVLNIITTLAMVRMGKVVSNLMVDLNASNEKLRDRAVRLVRELTQCDAEQALRALLKTHWSVKDAAASISGGLI